MKTWQANIGLLLVALIWASGYIATDESLKYLSVMQMQTFRFGLSTLILVIIFHKKLMKINKQTIILGTMIGIVSFIAMSVHSEALNTTTVSKNAFLVLLNVVFVPVFSYFIFKTKIKYYYALGISIMFLGFFLLIFDIDIFNLVKSFASLESQANLVWGDYLTIISSVFFAILYVLIAYSVKKVGIMNLVIIQLFVSWLLSIGFCLVNNEPLLNISSELFQPAIIPVVFLGIASALSYTGQNIFQKYVSPNNVAIILTTESLFASLFSVILGLEPFTIGLMLGAILITLGIVMAETGFKFKNGDEAK